ncbi:class I adenylate-forming enzyme family protein [Paracoccaceae bacterium Fryx2]|nr:class I adenylate-forming enzyme family protein [Paracoccaceae bacterium Fryx2]
MLSLLDLGPPAPCPAPFNLAAHVLARANLHPDKTALQIIAPGSAQDWTYGRLAAAVRGCGAGLLAAGLRPGDRILLRLGNTVDFPVVFLGAIAAGLVPVPTSAQLTVPEVTRMSAIVAPALIVAAEGLALPAAAPCPVLPAAALLAMEQGPACDWATGDPDRLAYIVFTSGTSGTPQAVAHAHRAVWARRMMHQGWEGLTPDDRLLHAGAFNWTYTLGTGLLDPWTVGATALIPAEGVPPADLPLLMRRHGATIFAAAPGVFRQMLRHPLPALPALRHGLSAGESLPAALREAWVAATGTAVHEALGLSECSTFISAAPGHPAPAGSTGYPQPGRRVAVLGPDGPVPRGSPGVLAVDGGDPGLFLGYLDDGEATAARFRDGWFLTGDSVSMAEDGAITYLGRDDDMMNAGGFRVSPLEVEAAMALCPGILDCAAAEVEVKPGATVIALFYVAAEPLDDAAISAFAATCLARWKQPRLFVSVPGLPRGPNHKLLRRALRQGHAAARQQQE